MHRSGCSSRLVLDYHGLFERIAKSFGQQSMSDVPPAGLGTVMRIIFSGYLRLCLRASYGTGQCQQAAQRDDSAP